MEGALRRALAMYADVVGFQLLKTDVPQPFEAAMLTSALAKLAITERTRFKAAKAVEFRAVTLAARYSLVAFVARAHGRARERTQRALANAAITRQTVAAELAAFGNVTERLGGRVSPHEVLDYAYWQLVVGESAPGLRAKPPLHDLLLGGRAAGPRGRRLDGQSDV